MAKFRHSHTHNISNIQKELDREWAQLTFGHSHSHRQVSDGIKAESFRLIQEREEDQAHHLNEVDFSLKRRIQELSLWIKEFTRKSEEVKEKEVIFGGVVLPRLEKCAEAIPPILIVDKKIEKVRESRIGIDKVGDEPYHHLQAEISLLESEYGRVLNLKAECEEALRLLRKTGHSLKKQLEDRSRAKSIDDLALSLNQHSSHVVSSVKRNYSGKRHNIQTESEWEEFSHKQRTATENLLRASDNLISLVESILRQVCEKLQSAVCTTNAAFEKRLIHLRQQKGKLEEEHREVSINIREMEDALDKLEKSITEKESCLSLTDARLALRSQRPNLELVNDEVDKLLRRELQTIQRSIQHLQLQLEMGQRSLRTLLANQMRLEEEINVKVNSIAIDETVVMPLRKTICVQPY